MRVTDLTYENVSHITANKLIELNGRNFEYMGEDPYLASRMVVPYIQGLQSKGVAACVKHYALNNDEEYRHQVNVTGKRQSARSGHTNCDRLPGRSHETCDGLPSGSHGPATFRQVNAMN